MAGGPHTLSFHVARLARPVLDLDAPPLRLDAAAFAPDAGAPADGPAPAGAAWTPAGRHADRSALADPLAALEGAPGLVTPPAAFGGVYLGEPFECALALVASPAGAGGADIVLRAELTAADGSVALLIDTTATPIPAIPPGARHDARLRVDVRSVGRHALALTASYTDPRAGERRHLAARFAFAAAPPLAVRTKVRADPARAPGTGALVEASVESLRRASALCLDRAAFDAAPGLAVEPLGADAGGPPLPIPPGGSTSFIFAVRVAGGGGGEPSPPLLARLPPDLGRLDLRWRTPFGGAGRLATQPVAAPPALGGGRVTLAVAGGPALAPLAAPFTLTLAAAAADGAPLGPLRLDMPDADPDSGLMVVGERGGRVCGSLAPGGTASVDITLVALRPGPHRLPPVRLVCEADGVAVAELAGAVAVADPAAG